MMRTSTKRQKQKQNINQAGFLGDKMNDMVSSSKNLSSIGDNVGGVVSTSGHLNSK